MTTKLDKANELKTQIDELEQFLFVVTKFDKNEKSIPSVNCFVSKKVKTEISIIGSRYFGIGTHEQTVIVPNMLRNNLIESCEKLIIELKQELSSYLVQK